MQLHVNDWNETTPLSPELLDFLNETGRRVLSLIGQPQDEAGVTLVDNATIRGMNLEYRGIDAPTDVLSFALDDGEPIGCCSSGSRDIPHLVGDVVISIEQAQAQSSEYGHTFRRELAFLLVHGLLHLYGYDHIEDADRTAMRRREEEILAELGLGRE